MLESPTPFICASGDQIPQLALCYETYGTLNASKDNAILVHHSLSTSAHLAANEQNPQPGWWQTVVGPNLPIDTNQFFVICINNLGSPFGSSAPTRINPDTGQLFGPNFAQFSITDIARSQQLVLAELGIDKLHAVIGNSMGGMISLAHAAHFPQQVQRLISISSCYKTYPFTRAIREVQRKLIKLDPAWQQGDYDHSDFAGMQLARQIGHLYYRNAQELNQRFADYADLDSYLSYNAQKFSRQFDPNCYLRLTEAMDHFDLSQEFATPEQAFTNIKAKTLVISVDSDRLFTPDQQHDLYQACQQAGVDATLIDHHSDYGHDAFYTDQAIAHAISDAIN